MTRHGPGFGLAEHQGERDGEAVVDVHPVDDGEIEVLLDHGLRDVPGEIRRAFHDGTGARAKAFVGGLEFVGAGNGEGGNEVEREGGGVVVVDEKDHVGLVGLLPLFRELEALEERRPVGLVPLRQCRSRGRWPGRVTWRGLR